MRTYCHSFHSLTLAVTRCTTQCYSLYYSLTFVVTCCHSMYRSSVFWQAILQACSGLFNRQKNRSFNLYWENQLNYLRIIHQQVWLKHNITVIIYWRVNQNIYVLWVWFYWHVCPTVCPSNCNTKSHKWHSISLFFLINVEGHNEKNVTASYFRKKVPEGEDGPKSHQNGPKIRFWGFWQKSNY